MPKAVKCIDIPPSTSRRAAALLPERGKGIATENKSYFSHPPKGICEKFPVSLGRREFDPQLSFSREIAHQERLLILLWWRDRC